MYMYWSKKHGRLADIEWEFIGNALAPPRGKPTKNPRLLNGRAEFCSRNSVGIWEGEAGEAPAEPRMSMDPQ